MWGMRTNALCKPFQAIRGYQIASRTRKVIPVYPPVEKREKDVVKKLAQEDLDKKLDVASWRRELVSKSSQGLKAGDIVRVVYDKSKNPMNDKFVGYIIAVDRKQLVQDCSILLRNHIGKTPVEVRVPIFSPAVERIDILKKATGSNDGNQAKRRRNKHYYIRDTKLDVGDLEAMLRKKK